MIDFLTYDLKVAAILAVFYMFYRVLLARETFHRVNRVVLLATAVASFVLPLCVITLHKTVVVESAPSVSFGALEAVADMSSETGMYPLWQSVAIALFFIGMAATLGHTLWSLFRIVKLIKHSQKYPQSDGTVICVTGNPDLAPFSWMHYIVMNRSDYLANDAAILTHERGHIRYHHSWDLLFVDTLTALQWFNPAIWMLRSDLRAIHEYEADGAVLSQGINARQYQYLLITKAASIGGYSLANGISHSTLKNRINMMLHTKSPRRSLLKLLALLPIIGAVLAVNAETVTDYEYTRPQKQMPIKKGRKNTVINIGGKKVLQIVETAEKKSEIAEPPAIEETVEPTSGKTYDVAEQMPQFPGGASKLFEYLASNIQYPAEAENANIQGRVIVSFVVEKDGRVSEPQVKKSVAPSLDAEALRVVGSMPKWIPGRQDGEAVRVKYTVPLNFRLQYGPSKDALAEKLVAYAAGYEAGRKGLNEQRSERPLIYVDGKEMTLEEVGKLDPKSIDHMNVLKEKTAIEKYGEKAKDGVILITTKK